MIHCGNFKNGDTTKQLLARSRYFYIKSTYKWPSLQNRRIGILIRMYLFPEEADSKSKV